MAERPTLHTDRLTLRPFTLADAPDVQRLAGAWEVASPTLNIPHPYPDGAAEEWIATHQPRFEAGELVNFAITRRSDGQLLGAIGLHLNARHHHAEMGYWMGVPYWGQGYTTEAAGAVLRYAFETLKLNRVYATHLTRNPASGRVMQKMGMQFEGVMRGHVYHWDQYEDLAQYGITRADYEAAGAA